MHASNDRKMFTAKHRVHCMCSRKTCTSASIKVRQYAGYYIYSIKTIKNVSVTNVLKMLKGTITVQPENSVGN